MARKKGYSVKMMADLILVNGEEVRDWLKVRKKPKEIKPLPQHEKFREYGRKVKEECESVRGDAVGMRICQAKVRRKVFRKKK